MRIYLSYHTPDGPQASALKLAIEAAMPGAEVFFVPEVLKAGRFWTPQLGRSLAQADAFLMLIGDRIGPYQLVECNLAMERHAIQPGFRLVPVLISDAAPSLPSLTLLDWIQAASPEAEPARSKIIAALRGAPIEKNREPWRAVAPYRCLEALREQDAALLFAREADTAMALKAIASGERRVVTVVGNSGAGKSSLIEAGVITALKRRRWPGGKSWSGDKSWPGGGKPWPETLADSREWAYLTMRPGEDPIRALLTAFMDLLFDEESEGGRIVQRERWRTLLGEGSEGISNLIDAVQARFPRERNLTPPRRVLLNIDQSEELYTLTPSGLRARFSELIAEGLKDARFLAVASLRSDFYGRLQDNRPLFNVSTRIDLPPLDASQLKIVATDPLLILGARCEPEELADAIVSGADGRPGSLALMSYFLTNLWKQMRERGDGVLRLVEASDAAEGAALDLAKSLSDHANRFAEAQGKDLDAVRRLFTSKLAIVQEDGRPAPRRAFGSELSAEEWLLVEELTRPEWRFLAVGEEGPGGGLYVEVAHEVLFESWAMLNEWLKIKRNYLVVRTPSKPAEPVRRRSPWTAVITTAAAALAVVAVVEGWQLRHAAIEREQTEEQQKAHAEEEERNEAAERRQTRETTEHLKAQAQEALKNAASATNALTEERRKAQAETERLRSEAGAALKNAASAADALAEERRKANAQTVRLRAQAEEARKSAANSSETLAEERRKTAAETERLKTQAEAALKSAESAADTLVFGAARRFSTVHGVRQTEINEILKRALQITDELRQTGDLTPEMKRIRAAALLQLTDNALALGDAEEAGKAAIEGAGLLRGLAEADPDNPARRYDMAVAHDKLAAVLEAQGDLKGALSSYKQSLDIVQRLVQANPANATWRRQTSWSYQQIGSVTEKMDNLPEALNAYRASLSIIEPLAAAVSASEDLVSDLSWAYIRLGGALQKQKELPDALKLYRSSLAICERMAAADPSSSAWSNNLRVAYDHLGSGLKDQRDLPNALIAYKSSLAVAQRLSDSAPDDADWRHTLAASFDNVGVMLEMLGDLMGALKHHEDSLALIEHLSDADPGNAAWRHDVAVSYNHIGNVQLALGHPAEALKAFQESLDRREMMVKASPENTGWQTELASSYLNVGDALEGQGAFAEAIKAYRSSLAIHEHLVETASDNLAEQAALAYANDRIGRASASMGDLPEALKAFRASIEIGERVSKAAPNDDRARKFLAWLYDQTGGILEKQGDSAGAIKAYRDGLAIKERLVQANLGDADQRVSLAISHEQIGSIAGEAKNIDEATSEYAKSLEIHEALCKEHPDNMEYRANSTVPMLNAGSLKGEQGEEDLRRGLTILKDLQAQGKLSPKWVSTIAWAREKLTEARVGEKSRKLQDSVTEEFGKSHFLEALKLKEEQVALIEQAESQTLGEVGAVTAGFLGEVGWYALFTNEYDKSLKASERAFALATDEGMRLAIATNKAHALMFLGRMEEARAVYLEHRGKDVLNQGKWESVIAKDFAELRTKGVSNPMMTEIEGLLGAQANAAEETSSTSAAVPGAKAN
jgi:tetratricopeptide (TPR) repeat protein